MRVSFLIPAYNEAATIGEVLERIAALGLDAQVIVVDDGSTDGTAAIAERPARPSSARRTAARARRSARRSRTIDGEIAVIQDADMEYDPAEVPRADRADRRVASPTSSSARASAGGKPQRAYLFWHLVGNRFLSLLTCVLYNTTLSDMETGYKAFRSDVLRSLELRENRLRDRAGDHREDLQAQAAHLRAADLLLRPHARRGQEDHLARRLPRDLGLAARASDPLGRRRVHDEGAGEMPDVSMLHERWDDADRADGLAPEDEAVAGSRFDRSLVRRVANFGIA